MESRNVLSAADPFTHSRRIDGLVRRSRGSLERQVLQSQPIIGTPCDVPVPSTSTLAAPALKG